MSCSATSNSPSSARASRCDTAAHRLEFDHTKQTRIASFAGSVEDVGARDRSRFDTPVAFGHDWRAHPAQGELVVDAGRSRARVATLGETRRRAWVGLEVDRDADGSYDEQSELRWDELLGGDSVRLFGELFGFAGAIRGFFVSPFGPETGHQLDAYVRIPRDDQPRTGTVRCEWYRNGQRLQVPLPDYTLSSDETTKGDFIEARLLFSASRSRRTGE